MTREEDILWNLNHEEQKIKAILEDDNFNPRKFDEEVAYVSGMHTMLKLLGYKAIEDTDKAENVNDYWIYTYKAIEDVR